MLQKKSDLSKPQVSCNRMLNLDRSSILAKSWTYKIFFKNFFSKKLIFTICFLDVSEHLELIGPPFWRTFFYTQKILGPLWPPQGPAGGPSLGLPFWNQKLTNKRPLHQIWHTFHNLKLLSLRENSKMFFPREGKMLDDLQEKFRKADKVPEGSKLIYHTPSDR